MELRKYELCGKALDKVGQFRGVVSNMKKALVCINRHLSKLTT
jgi:hypothetical protein